MKVDDLDVLSSKAKERFGDRKLTTKEINMLKRVMKSRMSTWLVEKTIGKKLSHEDRLQIIEWIKKQEEKQKN